MIQGAKLMLVGWRNPVFEALKYQMSAGGGRRGKYFDINIISTSLIPLEINKNCINYLLAVNLTRKTFKQKF